MDLLSIYCNAESQRQKQKLYHKKRGCFLDLLRRAPRNHMNYTMNLRFDNLCGMQFSIK